MPMNEYEVTPEQRVFLSILTDYVNGKHDSKVPADVDIDKLLTIANRQQLSPILFYQTKIPALHPAFASASYHAINKSKLIEKIDKEFQSANISYLIFKGLELAQYYQPPYLRTSGDIDMMVKECDKERAGKILEGFGFESDGNHASNHEWVYNKSYFEIELHQNLLYDENLNEEKIISFTDTAWEHATTTDGIRYHLEPEFHFAFLLLHLRKHFLWAGAGIRQFFDLVEMAKNSELDWNKVECYIESCGIQKFSSICFALIHRWFGVSIPLSTAQITEEFYYTATQTILLGGVFGDTSSETLRKNYIFNQAHRYGKIKSWLSTLFPTYEAMTEKYPTFRKNKCLLPLMWIKRMLDAILKHTAGDGVKCATSYLKNDKVRIDLLKEWGLYP